MQAQSKQVRGVPDVERLVVLQVLAGERTRSELSAELSDIDHEMVLDALASLAATDVVTVTRRSVRPSRCLRRLDDLRLICV